MAIQSLAHLSSSSSSVYCNKGLPSVSPPPPSLSLSVPWNPSLSTLSICTAWGGHSAPPRLKALKASQGISLRLRNEVLSHKWRLACALSSPTDRSNEGIVSVIGLSKVLLLMLLFADSFIQNVDFRHFFASLDMAPSYAASLLRSRALTFPFLVSAMATCLLGYFFIPFLRKLKADQVFRQEGPKSHFFKMGTPTMGGIFLIPVGVAVAILFSGISSELFCGVAIVTLAYAAIGMVDDCLSLIRRHNYGLPGWLKLLMQAGMGTIFYYWLIHSNVPSPSPMNTLIFPAPLGNVHIGALYMPLSAFCFAAMSNGVNLTDGLDGLAGGTSAAAFIGMGVAVLSFSPALGIFGASMAGACVGFLVHNHYKAAIFMGDTGSLALGGALAAMAVSTGTFFPLLIISLVFVLEAVSVLIQVSYFKITKRFLREGQRFFRMAPMHHHFELMGMKEPTIVCSAYVISCLAAILGGYVGLISAPKA